MGERITDIFDYGDEIVVVEEQVDWIDPARIKELTMNKINSDSNTSTGIKHIRNSTRKARRSALIAAVVAVLLIGTALAVYQHSMRDRTITVESDVLEEGYAQQFSPVGYTTETEAPSGEASHFIGSDEVRVSPADSTNREYLALKEWLEYFWGEHDEDLDVLLDQNDPYRYYGIGYEGLARHLQGIADKYDLRLYQGQALTSDLDEFFAILGTEPFLTMTGNYDGMGSCVAYDDGSFNLSGVKTPVVNQGENTELSINVSRAAKGSFCAFLIGGDDPEEYTYEEYTTAGGQSVDLALGSHYSFLFAELSDCWVTVSVNGGTVGSEYLPVIDMDALRQVADNMDFSLLAVNADGDYAERLAENQAEFEQRMADELAEADAERTEAEAAMAEETRIMKEMIGAWGLDTSLLPGKCTSWAEGSRAEGKLFDWMGDDRVVSAAQLNMYYVAAMDTGGEQMITLSSTRYFESGESITNGLLEPVAGSIGNLDNTKRMNSVSVNGSEAYVYEQVGVTAILWYDAEHDLMFQISAENRVPGVSEASDAWLVQLAESVTAQ